MDLQLSNSLFRPRKVRRSDKSSLSPSPWKKTTCSYEKFKIKQAMSGEQEDDSRDQFAVQKNSTKLLSLCLSPSKGVRGLNCCEDPPKPPVNAPANSNSMELHSAKSASDVLTPCSPECSTTSRFRSPAMSVHAGEFMTPIEVQMQQISRARQASKVKEVPIPVGMIPLRIESKFSEPSTRFNREKARSTDFLFLWRSRPSPASLM